MNRARGSGAGEGRDEGENVGQDFRRQFVDATARVQSFLHQASCKDQLREYSCELDVCKSRGKDDSINGVPVPHPGCTKWSVSDKRTELVQTHAK